MQKLKIHDLSIGDWVQWNGKAYRVCLIDGISLTVELAEELGGTIEVAIDELSGIPITPEILEKNGFVREIDGDNPVRTEYVFKHVNIVGFADCDFYHCRIWNPEGRGRILFPKIHYVHELQHALRLEGFKKEIEL